MMQVDNYNDEYKVEQSAMEMNSNLEKVTAIRALIAGRKLSEKEEENVKSIPLVNDFLNSQMGSPAESQMKKAVTAAIVTASDLGLTSFGKEFTAEQIATGVDEGLTRLKCDYLMGLDEANELHIDVRDAYKIQLDHTTVSQASIIDNYIDQLQDVVIENVDELIDKYFEKGVIALAASIAVCWPDVMNYLPYVSAVAEMAKPKVKELINVGISYGFDYLKDFVTNLVEQGVQSLKNIITKKEKQLQLA